ncbi:MAG TPA: type VI secretion system tip protein TssI/VgrG [Verrucomicrobiae bacterium]|nr:type VI secretion system tip protein TssI/VgrG [Verrucomicrobiae bacterium]
MDYQETDRPMRLTTPLGPNKLFPVEMHGREAISELFNFRIECVWADDSALDFSQLIGQNITLEMDLAAGTRYINGIVQSLAQGIHDPERNITHYFLDVVPEMWLLTRDIQCRIFQNKSVPDIIQAVWSKVGLTSTLKKTLTGTHSQRDYTVQFDESDFNFICRLMESEGIFYYFQHESGKHTCVIADSNSAFQSIPGNSTVKFDETQGAIRDESKIHQWTKVQELRSGKYSLQDWNFETPSTSLLVNQPTILKATGSSKLEIYEFPGGYMQKGDGETISKMRMNDEESPAIIVKGLSLHGAFCPAYKFTLSYDFSDNNKEFVLLSVEHAAKQPVHVGTDEDFEYTNAFTCMESSIVYRPSRVSPPPRVKGLHCAIVVGPAGEEIYTDKYSRVKVQFPWDRDGKNDENSSCWIRVATFWAGKNWGGIHVPRIGQEVLVDFVDGDVDRPLIIGSVYNANTMPPYALPANMTQSGVQSRSSKGGAAANYNEIRFEDKMGSEMVTLHAEKDQTIEVEHDESHWVGHDRTKKVDHDETVTIGNNRTETVKVDETITVQGKRTETVTGNETITVDQGNRSLTVSMGNDSTDIKMGNQSTNVDLGKIDETAMQSITLTVGQSSIKIDQMGVTIQGMMIKINGQIQVQVQGMMTQIQGSAMLQEQGGIIMIN